MQTIAQICNAAEAMAAEAAEQTGCNASPFDYTLYVLQVCGVSDHFDEQSLHAMAHAIQALTSKGMPAQSLPYRGSDFS